MTAPLDPTPVQRFLATRGLLTGLALLLVFGAIGLATDSTLAGVLAGAGLMIAIASFALKRSGRR